MISSTSSEKLSLCTDEPRKGSYLKQKISLPKQVAKAACLLCTINDKTAFEKNVVDRAKGA